jgi:hypothetical protein
LRKKLVAAGYKNKIFKGGLEKGLEKQVFGSDKTPSRTWHIINFWLRCAGSGCKNLFGTLFVRYLVIEAHYRNFIILVRTCYLSLHIVMCTENSWTTILHARGLHATRVSFCCDNIFMTILPFDIRCGRQLDRFSIACSLHVPILLSGESVFSKRRDSFCSLL